jgi:2-polyprenyl-3-methyl-5-hydroxy-6-metoxy-1,4-benzoquinol methylase
MKKQTFYDRYQSTHEVSCDGVLDLKLVERKMQRMGVVYRRFFPRDKDAKIADLGCGDGTLLLWLQQNGYVYAEGVDISQEQVQIARERGVKRIFCSDIISALEGKENFYDVLIMRDVLEHFVKQDALDILKACRKALRVGGRLILQVPNAESPFFGRIMFGDITHEMAYTSRSLTQILKVSGFHSDRFIEVLPPIVSLGSLLRRLIWSLFRIFILLVLIAEAGKNNFFLTQNILCLASKTEI